MLNLGCCADFSLFQSGTDELKRITENALSGSPGLSSTDLDVTAFDVKGFAEGMGFQLSG